MTMPKMSQLKTYLVISAICMVAYARTVSEFRPNSSACGTVTAIQVVVNPTQEDLDKSNGCMYIKTEISSFLPVSNSTVSNSTAMPWK